MCLPLFSMGKQFQDERLEGTFGHPLVQPCCSLGPAHCGSEFPKDAELTAPLGNLFYSLTPLTVKIENFGLLEWNFLDLGLFLLLLTLQAGAQGEKSACVFFVLSPRCLYTFIDPSCTTSS